MIRPPLIRNVSRATWLALVVSGAGAIPTSGEPAKPRRLEALSPVYTVDQVYRSMTGPRSTQTLSFPEAESPALLWITGFRAEMVAEDGETPMSQEFMCHSNLDFDRQRHSRLLSLPIYHTDRLFTLSQGQLEIDLPDGFGLPYYSDETLQLTTQVLNLNPGDETRRVRHKITVDYVRDADLERPMKPLFMTSGWGLVSLDGEPAFFGTSDAPLEHAASCLPGEGAAHDERSDSLGQTFSGHWVVKPGREVNRTLVTHLLRIPYDTTVHYIAVHLHPFAESLELVDLTAQKTVFKSMVAANEDSIGIRRVEHFSSVEGIPVFADHEYELVSVYHNTTTEDQDSMAVMLLYLLDKEFHKPEPVDLSDL